MESGWISSPGTQLLQSVNAKACLNAQLRNGLSEQ